MIGDAILYAASRAAGPAAERLTRTVTWFAVAGFMFVVATTFGVVALFWYLEPRLGSIPAALSIAGGACLVAFTCLAIPSVSAIADERAENGNPPIASAFESAETEAREAVNYFGAARVLMSAFILGLSAARTLKGR